MARATTVTVDGHELTLAGFLDYCATGQTPDRMDGAAGPDGGALRRARELFVRAGRDALAAAPATAGWHQLGVGPVSDPERRRRLCARVRELVTRLRGENAVDNFFFLHKPPGLRLRFQPSDRAAPDLGDALYAEAAGWRDEGLVDRILPGVYEPESVLFGGPVSMPYVHALFTVDSLTWLAFHTDPPPEPAGSVAPWAVSLVTLRTLFTGLDITGEEDLGVWDRVRTGAGRRLAPEVIGTDGYRDVAAQVRAMWSAPEEALDQLPPRLLTALIAHRESLHAGAARWRDGYFTTRAAHLGPRAAAAAYVVFHWNRAGLSPAQQAVLAESLAGQEG